MKNYICCFILLLCSFYIHAQSSQKLDSLKKVLAKLPPEGRSFAGDTTRVRLLCEMGEDGLKDKKDSTIILIKKALFLSEKLKYKNGLLKTNMLLAIFYKSQSLRASEYLFKALVLGEDMKRYKDLLLITSMIANNYSKLSDFESALKYYRYHSDLCNKYGSKEDYLLSLNSIAFTYGYAKDYKKELDFLNLCEQKNLSVKSNKVTTATLINIAKTNIALGNYDGALERFKKAINVDDGYGDRIAYTCNEIANLYLLKGDLKEALFYAKKALDNSKKVTYPLIESISKTLSDIYVKLNRKDLAYPHLSRYIQAKLNEDSVKNSQLNRFINLDYQSEKQFQLIAQLNLDVKEQENRNKLLLFGVIATIITISVILFFYRSLQKKNILIEEQKKAIEDLNKNLEVKVQQRTQELLKVNEELIKKNFEITEALFKGQTIERKRVAVELHDNLGSMLSGMKWRLQALNKDQLSEKEQKVYDGILTMMGDAYSEVRLISHNLLPAELEEKGLFGAIQKLINDINLSEKLNVSLNIEKGIIINDNKIALELYSICMELVNNILKHSGATKASINFYLQNGQLNLKITDNGKGILPEIQTNGIGLKNIQHRINTLNGNIEMNDSVFGETTFLLKIPNGQMIGLELDV